MDRRLERGHELAKPRVAAPGFPERLESDYGLVRLAVIRDTLDSVVFPLRGSRTELALSLFGMTPPGAEVTSAGRAPSSSANSASRCSRHPRTGPEPCAA